MWELRVTNIRGAIGINKHDAFLNIRQTKPQVQIETEGPKVNPATTHPQIRINQSQCFSEIGLKGIADVSAKFAGEGQAAVFDFISSTLAEGERLAQFQSSSDAVAEIAAEKALPPPPEINVDFIPHSRPVIDFIGGVRFEPEPGKISVSLEWGKTEFSADKAAVEVYMQKNPLFKFEFVGSQVDMSI